MTDADFSQRVGERLAGALKKRGFTGLTPVQEAVLDPALADRDLRITSQTGSGKTVAIGFALQDFLSDGDVPARTVRVLVITPTRELAKQVEEELAWLYAPLHIHLACVTGGANYSLERRALAAHPAVVVGTPGRLLDHLERGAIDTSELRAFVIDEADRMLDLGFREDLEAILGHSPGGHRTHLVSATFPRDVRALADRVQSDPAHVEGTPLGSANADIEHVIHLVDSRERVAAIINLLLGDPGAQTLVFARTRADVAQLARELSEAGFTVSSLSGEMEQRERNRALAAFKRGELDVLVATDVAARGLDVQDIARVIHAEPPSNAEDYTHRSGRTGRAGKKGTSSVLVSPGALQRTSFLLKRAGVGYRFEPIPTAEQIRAAGDERLFEELTLGTSAEPIDDRIVGLAKRLLATGNATSVVARLLARSRKSGQAEPRTFRVISPPTERDRPQRGERPTRPAHSPRDRKENSERGNASGRWTPFRVTWGREHGADPRRLLAMVCRRGGIEGGDVGAIDVDRYHAIVNVREEVAESFAQEAKAPDPRNPRVRIERERPGSEAHRSPGPPHHARAPHPRAPGAPKPSRGKPGKSKGRW